MQEFLNLNRTELENNLSTEQLRISQIISLAMVTGVLLFCAVVILMYVQNEPPLDPQIQETSIIPTLTLFLLILGLINYGLFTFLIKIIYSPQKIKGILSEPFSMYQTEKITEPALRLLIMHRTMMIIRMAMLEGVALFGIVILFLCVKEGIIYINSNYWFLLTPAFIMFLYIGKNFPTKQKVAEQIEENFLKPLRTIN